jgi:hypothetical protein
MVTTPRRASTIAMSYRPACVEVRGVPTGQRQDCAARALLLAVLAALVPSCGSDTPTDPTSLDVRVAYVSQLPAGCPDQANPCYPMCVHGATPAAQMVLPLWGADSIRLTQTATGRYEGTLPAVPTNTPLRLLGKDVGMCCFDSCNYPPVLEDILLNGTKLTKVVHDGLPAGITEALEFTLKGDGTIQN